MSKQGSKKRKRKKRNRQGQRITPPKTMEVRYRKRLLAIVNQINRLVKKKLIPAIRRLEPEFTADSKQSARNQLVSLLNSLNSQVQPGDKSSLKWAESFVNGTNKVNERRNFEMFKRATGIDLKRVVMNEGIEKGLKSDIKANVNLIKSIPDTYFKRINKIFEEALLKEQPASSLIEQITALGESTKKRAKFIARDQTATISGKLNERRSMNLGSVGYKWQTSGDQRVRGNPSGLYPDSAFSHFARNGEYFLWKDSNKKIIAPNGKPFRKPPPDGAPGIPIACRCTAIPVVQV